jgi:hypothetical protein
MMTGPSSAPIPLRRVLPRRTQHLCALAELKARNTVDLSTRKTMRDRQMTLSRRQQPHQRPEMPRRDTIASDPVPLSP